MPQQIVQYGASRAVTVGYQLTAQPCTLYRLDGYCNGAAGTNTWLQVFDANAAPSTNDVPKKSLMLAEANGYSYTFLKEDMVSFTTGIYLALSKDPTKFVAVTDAATTSGDATIEDLSIVNGATQVGPTDVFGTGVFDVWDASAGLKKLAQLVFSNGAAAATKRWLVIAATLTGDTDIGNVMLYYPLFTTSNGDGTGTVTNRSSGVLKFADLFDNKGLDVFGKVKSTGAQAIGCAVLLTSTVNPASVNPNNLILVSDEHTTLTAFYQ